VTIYNIQPKASWSLSRTRPHHAKNELVRDCMIVMERNHSSRSADFMHDAYCVNSSGRYGAATQRC